MAWISLVRATRILKCVGSFFYHIFVMKILFFVFYIDHFAILLLSSLFALLVHTLRLVGSRAHAAARHFERTRINQRGAASWVVDTSVAICAHDCNIYQRGARVVNRRRRRRRRLRQRRRRWRRRRRSLPLVVAARRRFCRHRRRRARESRRIAAQINVAFDRCALMFELPNCSRRLYNKFWQCERRLECQRARAQALNAATSSANETTATVSQRL